MADKCLAKPSQSPLQLACVQTSPLPQEKSGEEAFANSLCTASPPLPFEGRGGCTQAVCESPTIIVFPFPRNVGGRL